MTLVAVKAGKTARQWCTLSFLALLLSLAGCQAEPGSVIYRVTGSDVTRTGADIALVCQAVDTGSVVPLPAFTWFKDGNLIPGQTGYVLRLNPVTKQDEGLYQCGGQDSSSGGNSLSLHVFAPGDVLPLPSVYSNEWPVEGRPNFLTCHFRHYVVNDKTAFTWYKDSTEVKGQTAQMLKFPPLTAADEGKYTCTAREGPVSSTSPPSLGYNLVLQVSPNVTIEPPSSNHVVKGILGQELTLTCKVIRAVPRVPADGYSWSYLPYPQAQLRPLVGKTRTLTLGPLTREDRGQYFCQARNDRDLEHLNLTGHASVTLDVVYLETFSLTPDLEVSKGDPVTLTCSVDSHPTAKLTWTVNGQKVRHVIYNVDHYVIMSAACSDSNNYTCAASNTELPGLERNATTQLTVNCSQAASASHTTLPPRATTRLAAEQPDAKSGPWTMEAIVPTAILGIIGIAAAVLVLLWQRLTESQRRNLLSKVFNYFCPPQTEGTESHSSIEGQAAVDMDSLSLQESTIPDEFSGLLESDTADSSLQTAGLRDRRGKRQRSHDSKGSETWEPSPRLLFRHKSSSETRTVPPAQGQRVRFEDVYKKGKVYVLPFLEGMESRGIVIKRLHQALSAAALHGDPPVFLCTESLPCYMHAIVYCQLYGVIAVKACSLVSVNAATHSHLKHAVKELVEAGKRLRKELHDLLHQDGVTLLLALPDLKSSEELSDKERNWLRERNIQVVVGKVKADYQGWLQTLLSTKQPELWGLGADSNHAFRTAVSSFLSMRSYGDDSDPPTWLLTREQASVLQSTDKLVHIQGPPGSGKTLLLMDRVRRWLSRGKIVVLAVSSPHYELLLHRLARLSLEDLPDDTADSLKLCKTLKELKMEIAALKETTQLSEICVAIDAIKIEFLPILLDVYSSSFVETAWSTSRAGFPEPQEFQKLGGHSAPLSRCLRSPAILQDLARKIMPPGANIAPWADPPRPDPPGFLCLPRVTVEPHASHPGDHASHPGYQAAAFPEFDCDKCDAWLKRSLSLPLLNPEQWKHWVVLLTGDWGPDSLLTDRLVGWLTRQGVLAVHEWKLNDRDSSASTSSLASSDVTPQKAEDRAALRARVEASEDREGRPAVHVMRGSLFRGLEKPRVLVVHYDGKDDHPDHQSKEDQISRLQRHRYQLFRATIRCQAVLAVLLLSPSPATSLLPLNVSRDEDIPPWSWRLVHQAT